MSQKPAKFLVPLCMIIGIGLLWYLHKGQEAVSPEPIVMEGAMEGAVATSHSATHADFALNASHIDLEALKKHGVPMIIDFGADSCIPCKEMAPVLRKLNAEMQNVALIKFVDVWKNPKGADGFPVQVIPTQIFVLADGTPYTPKDVQDVPFRMYSTKDTKEHVFTVHQGGLNEDQMRRILKDMQSMTSEAQKDKN